METNDIIYMYDPNLLQRLDVEMDFGIASVVGQEYLMLSVDEFKKYESFSKDGYFIFLEKSFFH